MRLHGYPNHAQLKAALAKTERIAQRATVEPKPKDAH